MSTYTTTNTTFTDATIDFSSIESYFTNAELLPPTINLDDDLSWLDAIPLCQPSPSAATISSESTNNTPDLPNDTTWSFHTPQAAATPEEESTPITRTPLPPQHPESGPRHWMLLREAIDITATVQSHEMFARMSIESEGRLPLTAEERWTDFSDMDSDELYRKLYYFRYFFGDYFLSDWQKKFVSDCSKVSQDSCFFCKLPKGYWCEEVAVIPAARYGEK